MKSHGQASLHTHPKIVIACTFLAIFTIAFLPLRARAMALLEIDGISGAATMPGYEDALELVSFTTAQGIDHQGGGSGLAELAPLYITRYLDIAAAPLARSVFQQNTLQDWKLSVFDGAGKVRMTLELCDVFTSRFLIFHSEDAESLPVEQVEFSYGGFRLGVFKPSTGNFDYTDHENGTCTVGGPPTPLDTDGDGLTDAEEAVLGTNPDSVDTDGDGLVDGAGGIISLAQYPAGIDNNGDGYADGEADYGTDPTLRDTDEDTFDDDVEVIAGSDPLDENSTPVPPIPDGDLNGDTVVDLADVLLAQQLLRGELEVTQEHLDRGDVAPVVGGVSVPDGVFDLGDLLIIQRKVSD